MKKIIAIAALCAVGLSSFGQGRVNFSTQIPGLPATSSIKATDGTTALSGSWHVQLWGGLGSGLAENALTAMSSVLTLTFNTGTFNGGTVYPKNPPPGSITDSIQGAATLQYRVWDAAVADWNTAAMTIGTVMGKSQTFNHTVTAAPDTSVNLLGYGTANANGFALAANPVPEPSVIALGVLGALALLFRRRK